MSTEVQKSIRTAATNHSLETVQSVPVPKTTLQIDASVREMILCNSKNTFHFFATLVKYLLFLMF